MPKMLCTTQGIFILAMIWSKTRGIATAVTQDRCAIRTETGNSRKLLYGSFEVMADSL